MTARGWIALAFVACTCCACAANHPVDVRLEAGVDDVNEADEPVTVCTYNTCERPEAGAVSDSATGTGGCNGPGCSGGGMGGAPGPGSGGHGIK